MPPKNTQAELKSWLSNFGLQRFEAVFLENEINLSFMRIINRENLATMGISPTDIVPISEAISRWQINEINFTNQGAEERKRQLIVLICDVVNSTQYHSEIDIEKADAFEKKYHAIISDHVRAQSGTIQQSNTMGDSVTATFGYPYSEESIAQAINCGLNLIEDLSNSYEQGFNNIGIKVGIACETAVVPVDNQPKDNYGLVAYRASRLQSLAEKNTVLVDENIWASAKTLFEFTDRGKKQLKGFAGYHQTWKVDAVKNVSTRFERRENTSPFLGRASQIEAFEKAFQSVVDNNDVQIAYLWGDAGIGKSRLVHEIISHSEGSNSSNIVFQCVENYEDTPYHPILERLKHELNITQSVTNIRTVLEEFLSVLPIALERSYPVFAQLLGGKLEQNEESPLSIENQEMVIFKVLVEYMRQLSDNNPLILVLEDAHWADNSTIQLFDYLSRNLKNNPVLVCITSRDHLENSSFNITFNFIEHLHRLNVETANQLLDISTGQFSISAEKRTHILKYAEGNPLYIEELAAGSVLKQDNKLDDGSISLSSSLQGSLLTRLDSLKDAIELAQTAALIGRTFDFNLLREVNTLSKENFGSAIKSLADTNLISINKGSNTGVFKHALLQEALKDMLVRNAKANLHQKIASSLEKQFAIQGIPEYEILAHHYTEANDHAKAIRNWLTHGEKLASTWAKTEAVTVFERALKLIDRLDFGPEKTKLELSVLVELGDILYEHYGHLTPKAEQAYDRSLAISKELMDYEKTNRILDGVFGIKFNAGEFEGSIKTGIDLVSLYESSNYFPSLVLGEQFQGMGKYHLAEFESAEKLLQACLKHVERAEEVGSHYPSMPLIYLAWTQFKLGKIEAAEKSFYAAKKAIPSQSHYQNTAYCGNGCILYSMMGNAAKVKELVVPLLQVSEEYGFKLWNNMGQFFTGWLLAIEKSSSGISQMQQMVDSMTDHLVDKTLFLGLLGSSYLNIGDNENAKRVVEEAISLGNITGEKYYFQELYELKERVSNV